MSKPTIILLTACFCFGVFFALTPWGKTLTNQYLFSIQKADDRTSYETLRKVEDTCRAMKSSYESDKLAYEQYHNGNAEQQSWAAQAKMRANKTAASYNEYILKNNFVWKEGVPPDAYGALPYLRD